LLFVRQKLQNTLSGRSFEAMYGGSFDRKLSDVFTLFFKET